MGVRRTTRKGLQMLNITQVMRIRGGKMLNITRKTYPNTLDAIRYYYVMRGTPEQRIPLLLALNINQVYLDRLEVFIKDEIDLPEFYAFATGKSKESVRRRVGYPIANNAFNYILEAIEGNNNYENGPRVTAEIKFPEPIEMGYATGGTFSIDTTKLFGQFGHESCESHRGQPGTGPGKEEPK